MRSIRQLHHMNTTKLTSAFWTRIVGRRLYRPRLDSDMISCGVSWVRRRATTSSPAAEST